MGRSSSSRSGCPVARLRVGQWVILPDNLVDGCPFRPARVERIWPARYVGDDVVVRFRFCRRSDGGLRARGVLWQFEDDGRLEVRARPEAWER